MGIQVGGKVPSVKVKVVRADGTKEANSAELFAGKKVVLFGALVVQAAPSTSRLYVARSR